MESRPGRSDQPVAHVFDILITVNGCTTISVEDVKPASATSMTSTPTSFATLADLPDELYGEITDNLGSPKDTRTLLSLALVDRAWCAQSQRVLFKTVCDNWIYEKELDTVVRRHIRFLQTIIKTPKKLGPYVRTYAQNELAFPPESKHNSY